MLPGVDTAKASVARVYDYWLGGTHNFQADRDAAQALESFEPGVPALARANRGFLGRAVQFLADAGVRQFLDIGAGIPTQRSVHQIAQAAAPGAAAGYQSRVAQLAVRSRAAIERFFDGLELVAPGVVTLPEWRPRPGPVRTGDPAMSWALAGAGRKP